MAIVKYGSKSSGELSQMAYGGLEVTEVDFMGNPTANMSSPLYCVQINVAPSTLTTGTVYWILQAGTGKTIQIVWLNVSTSFHGTPAASTSHLELIRLGSGTFTPNTTPSIMGPAATAGAALSTCAQAAGGVTVSGAAYESNGPIVMGLSNQITAGVPWGLQAATRGWEVPTGNSIAIRASGAIVSGFAFRGGCFFMEY